MLCFAFVVYVIQRYIEQREALAKRFSSSVMTSKDVGLAAQVNACFFPRATGHCRTRNSRHDAASAGVGGDYYDYIPINAQPSRWSLPTYPAMAFPPPLDVATAAAMSLVVDLNMAAAVGTSRRAAGTPLPIVGNDHLDGCALMGI